MGAKVKDFPIKFKTFIFTNSKSPKIFRRSVKISKNPTILKKLEGHVHLLVENFPEIQIKTRLPAQACSQFALNLPPNFRLVLL